MNIQELKAHIEGRFKWTPGLPLPKCQTGEEYKLFSTTSESESQACDSVLREFNKYASAFNQNAVLYWRTLPSLEGIIYRNDHPTKFVVYMRLCLSSRPVKFTTMREYGRMSRRTAKR